MTRNVQISSNPGPVRLLISNQVSPELLITQDPFPSGLRTAHNDFMGFGQDVYRAPGLTQQRPKCRNVPGG